MTMRTREENKFGLRVALAAGTSVLTLCVAGAFAQDTTRDGLGDAEFADDVDLIEENNAGIEEEDDSDTIVVTGSRVRRSEFNSISPIQVISGEVSRDLGLVNAADILNQTSVVQGQQTTVGVSTVTATGQAFTTFGSVTPSLRGLSSSTTGRTRNLILVNGRRYGPIGVGGSPANPDVSLIPGTLIQGVDFLLDGASSVYGSDAIAGVINYRLQDDFEGFEVDAFYQTNELDKGQQLVLSAKAGVRSDRGFAMIAGEINDQKGLRRRDRFPRYVDFVDSDFGPQTCDPELEINTNTGEVFSGCSSFLADFGVFGPNGTVVVTPGETNIGVPGFSTLGIAPFDGEDSVGTFGSNQNPFTRSFPQDQEAFSIPPTQRFTVFSIGEYETEWATDATLYYELNYAERELEQTSFAQGVLEVTEDTPFNPGIGSQLLVPLLRFQNTQNIDVFRATAGIRGNLDFLEDVGLNNWTYDAFTLFHRSRGTQLNFGDLSNVNVARVLNGTTDETTGQFTCALDETIEQQQPTRNGTGGFTTPVTNCDAVNFFDPQFLTTGRFSDPFANDFILTSTIQNTTVEQVTVNGFVTGELFDIPTGGPLSVVVGGEYRYDEVNTQNDENQSTSNALATQNPDVGSLGDRRILEAFGEIVIPLVRDRPGIKALDIELAGRFTDEEFFGSAETYNVKVGYSPTDWLSFSAGFGTAFRAPDTGEQFGTGIIFANNTRIDPCLPSTDTIVTAEGDTVVDGVTIPDGTVFYDATQDERVQSTIDLCTALGVSLPSGPLDVDGAAALGIFGLGTPSGSFQNFAVLFGNDGNLDIGPETSEALFLKATFTQPWFDGFNFSGSANYFEYEVSDSIGQLTAGTILNACFDPQSSVQDGVAVGDLCEFQTRNPDTGLLTAVNEASFNLGSLTSRGIDLNLQGDVDLTFLDGTAIGEKLDAPINLGFVYRGTRQLENAEDITGNGEFDQLLETFGFPIYQHNLTGTLNYDRFSLLYRWFFQVAADEGEDFEPFGGGTVCAPTILERDGPDADTSGCTEFISLPNVDLHDLTASYRGDTFVIRAGIRNLYDTVVVRDAAIPGDGATGTPFGLGYDLDGRNYFINISKSF